MSYDLCYPWHELWIGKVAETPVVLEPVKDSTRRKNYGRIGAEKNSSAKNSHYHRLSPWKWKP